MTAGGPRPPYPPQPPPAPRPPMQPVRPKRPVPRLVGGLLWLVAAGMAVGGTFSDLFSRTTPSGQSTAFIGFWEQTITSGQRTQEGPTVYYGIPVVAAAVFLVVAFLVALFTVRRWAAIVAGTFGTAMLLTAALHWFLVMAVDQPGDGGYSIELGLWLVTGATLVALIGLVVALAERAIPVFRPMYAPPLPPLPPPPPRWEPQTPRYGVPVQQPPAPEQPTTHLDQPEHTSSITPTNHTPAQDPEAPEPGSISRKLDGDDK
jgi:hypothetical protein